MIWINVSVEWMANFIEFFLFYCIEDVLFDKYRKIKNVKYEIIFSFVGMVFTTIFNYWKNFSYFTLLMGVLYLSISSVFLYYANYITLFSISSFYVLCISCLDFFRFLIISRVHGGGFHNFLYLIMHKSGIERVCIVILEKWLWILIYFLIRKYCKNILVRKNYKYTLIITTFIGIFGFLFLANQTFSSFKNSLSEVWMLFLIILGILIFMFYFFFEDRSNKIQLTYSKIQNALLEEKYKEIKDVYTRNAKLYHDLNNHLNILYQMLEKKRVEEAKNYIENIGKPIKQLSKTTWTGIDLIDAILSIKIQQMKEKNAKVFVNAEFPRNTNLQINDMCTILGNLLDNVIEAIERSGDTQKVIIIIRRVHQFLLIKISNTYTDKSEKSEKKVQGIMPKTTKKNKEFHGWGLENVKTAVEKYQGIMKIESQNEKFTVNVMLFYEYEKENF